MQFKFPFESSLNLERSDSLPLFRVPDLCVNMLLFNYACTCLIFNLLRSVIGNSEGKTQANNVCLQFNVT